MARELKKVLRKTENFAAIKGKVAAIMNTENSYYVSSMNSVKRRHLLDLDKYSTYGLSSAGAKIGFPPQFIERYGEKHPEGAKKILTDLYGDTIAKMTDEKNTRGAKKLFVRDFYDKHYALLTDRYAVFDDNEIVDFLQQNEYLMNAEEFWYSISPERKLSVGREAADKILTSFKLYGGKSKWDLTNAITDYAHNVNLDDRINLEAKALMVA